MGNCGVGDGEPARFHGGARPEHSGAWAGAGDHAGHVPRLRRPRSWGRTQGKAEPSRRGRRPLRPGARSGEGSDHTSLLLQMSNA